MSTHVRSSINPLSIPTKHEYVKSLFPVYEILSLYKKNYFLVEDLTKHIEDLIKTMGKIGLNTGHRNMFSKISNSV